MATSKPTITTIQDTFTTLVTNTNTVSLDLGATGRLNTNEDSSAVAAINELELAIRGTSNDLVATDLSQAGITANNIVSALVEHDVDLHGAGGGAASTDLTTIANDVISGINELDSDIGARPHTTLTTIAKNLTAAINELDSDVGARPHTNLTTVAKNLVSAVNELDAELGTITSGAMGTSASTVGAAISELEVEIDTLNTKVEPTQALTTSSSTLSDAVNELDAELGDSAMGSEVSGASTVTGHINAINEMIGDSAGELTTTASTVVSSINELDAELGTITAGAMGTTASTVSGAIYELEQEIDFLNSKVEPDQALTTSANSAMDAINELDAEIGSETLTTTATTLAGAINEHDTEIGAAALNTSATTLRGAINEVHTTIGKDIDSDGLNGNLANNNIGLGLYRLDSAIGDLDDLNDDGTIGNRLNLVRVANSLADDIALLDADQTTVNSRLGSLNLLDSDGFVGAERDNFVAALNALRADIPLIYDENGTKLN